MGPLIYLDNNATTAMDPQVLEAMLPYLKDQYGNASSLMHGLGRTAAAAMEKSRLQVAGLIHAPETDTILFTSGATEAINTVLKGVFEQYQSKGKHFITCKTEHKAVLDTFAHLEKKGAEVTYLDVDYLGRLDPEQLEASIRPDTILIALMSANNETGVSHPIAELSQIAQKHNVLFFCDATQSIGKQNIDLSQTPIDLLCLSAHKFHGPKGAGALYIRKKNKRIQIAPLLHGGGQEHGLRAGTLNVPAIVGMGKAAELAKAKLDTEIIRLARLRDKLENMILTLPQTYVNGLGTERLPHVSNITIRHLRAASLIARLPMLCLSTGSACVSGSRDPSHVLIAMGRNPEDAFSSIRLSLGRFNTEEEIVQAGTQICGAIVALRAESPNWQLFEKGMIP